MIVRGLNLNCPLQPRDDLGVYAVEQYYVDRSKNIITISRRIHQCLLLLRCRFFTC